MLASLSKTSTTDSSNSNICLPSLIESDRHIIKHFAKRYGALLSPAASRSTVVTSTQTNVKVAIANLIQQIIPEISATTTVKPSKKKPSNLNTTKKINKNGRKRKLVNSSTSSSSSSSSSSSDSSDDERGENLLLKKKEICNPKKTKKWLVKPFQ